NITAYGTSIIFPITLTLELLDQFGEIHSSPAGKTELTTYVTLTLLNDVPRLDVKLRIENNLESYRLLARFPLPYQAESAYYDAPFEIVQRPTNGGIMPQGTFVGVFEPLAANGASAGTGADGAQRGLIIANRGLPEVEVTSDDQRTTIS